MQNIGQRKFIEIPGPSKKTFELPPLLLSSDVVIGEKTFKSAEKIVESELLSDSLHNQAGFEEAKICLTSELVEKYKTFRITWSLGNSVFKWIEECEEQFKINLALQNILNHNVWPHAGQHSFVSLLQDKYPMQLVGCDLKTAVGLRMFFTKPLPISFFTNQFVFYLFTEVAETSYNRWSNLAPKPVLDLPPERFHFDVLDI